MKPYLDNPWFDGLEEAVGRAEKKTSAEIVVAVLPRVGEDRDVDWATGSAVGFLVLLFIVFNPWTTHSPTLLPLEFATAFAAGCLTSWAWPGWRRFWVSSARREERVREAALALFTARGIAHTRDRTGLLVFVALEERVTEVVADVGISRALPTDVWTDCLVRLRELAGTAVVRESLPGEIERLGDVFAPHLPPREDDVDEISNTPYRTRS